MRLKSSRVSDDDESRRRRRRRRRRRGSSVDAAACLSVCLKTNHLKFEGFVFSSNFTVTSLSMQLALCRRTRTREKHSAPVVLSHSYKQATAPYPITN